MRNNLAQILVDNYDINEEVLAEATRIKSEKGGNIGEILVQ